MIASIKRYIYDTTANALAEVAILFPVLLTLLMGVYDIGQGIIVNQKAIASSQIVGDLITRNREVDMATVNDIVRAGRMALEPFRTDTYGYDIVSVYFDEDGNPDIEWRVTDNMLPNDEALLTVENILELTSEGILIVTTQYPYVPVFTDFITEQIDMREVAFLRGRGNSLIQCADCPGGS